MRPSRRAAGESDRVEAWMYPPRLIVSSGSSLVHPRTHLSMQSGVIETLDMPARTSRSLAVFLVTRGGSDLLGDDQAAGDFLAIGVDVDPVWRLGIARIVAVDVDVEDEA